MFVDKIKKCLKIHRFFGGFPANPVQVQRKEITGECAETGSDTGTSVKYVNGV